MNPEDKIELSETCLKLDRANAKAMIEGFEKDGEKFKQAIYCVVEEKRMPMLITLNKTTDLLYKLSSIGNKLCQKNYSLPFKYIAIPVKHYPVPNDLEFWKIVCSNGLFDIWDAEEGPLKRFSDPKICNADSSKYKILLLRVWEVKEQFMQNEVRHAGKMYNKIIRKNNWVTLNKPIIGDKEFEEIKKLLEETIRIYEFDNSRKGAKE